MLVDNIFVALAAQTVTVPGTEAAERVNPQLAANVKALKAQRDTIAGQVDSMLEDFYASEVLDRIRRESASSPQHRSCFPSVMDPTSHPLATYAGIAPVTRRSGSSIRGEFPSRTGNKRLKKCAVLLKRLLPFEVTKHPEPTTGAKEQKANATMRPTHVSSQTQMQRHLRHAQIYRETLTKQSVAV